MGKSSSILINTSRGGIINQGDLVSALKEGKIFAAGLDVMTPEPLPTDHPLAQLDNCVLVKFSSLLLLMLLLLLLQDLCLWFGCHDPRTIAHGPPSCTT